MTGPARREDQADAIFDAALNCFDLFNLEFRKAMQDVLAVAALAFDDDADLRPWQFESLERITCFMWGHLKGQLEHAVRDSGLDAPARADWMRALEAVYRIAGSDHVSPVYGGAL